jgi:hypothetical protein
MRVSRRWLTTAAATALSVAAWGCSDKPSVESTTAEAKVTGTVKVYGKPMTSGTVTLDPTNYARANVGARKGEIKSDGTYEVTTLLGKNRVLVDGPEITKNPELRYANYSVDVPSGGTTYDIILPPPNTPKK